MAALPAPLPAPPPRRRTPRRRRPPTPGRPREPRRPRPRPADAPLLDSLLAGLSERSRYQRFQTAKPRLNSRERAFLAGADGHHHLALVALDPAGAPLAVARAVRLRDRPDTAEIAAEVVDAWQRRGLGSDLIARLARRVGRGRAAAASPRRCSPRRASRARSCAAAGASSSMDGPTTDLQVDVWALLSAAR